MSELAGLVSAAIAKDGYDAVTNLQPVALGARLRAGVDVDSEQALIADAIEVTPIVNPLLDAVLVLAGGARRGARAYAFSVGKEGIDAGSLAAAFDALPGGMLYDSRTSLEYLDRSYSAFSTLPRGWAASNVRRMLQDLNTTTSRALAQSSVDLDQAHPTSGPNASCGVLLNSQPGLLWVRIVTSNLRIAVDDGGPSGIRDYDLDLLRPDGRRDPLQLPAAEAFALLETARKLGLPVVDLNTGERTGSLAAVRARLRRAVIAHPVHGSPGLAALSIGSGVSSRTRNRLTKGSSGTGLSTVRSEVTAVVAAEAAADQAQRRNGVGVSHPNVVDMAAIGAAVPAGREGLRPYQDQVVSLHLAAAGSPMATSGYVNALAPGLGKTITSLAAFRERAAATPRWRGYVSCPAAIRSQWRSETAVFFPEATTLTLYKSTDVGKLEALSAEVGDAPLLVIGSYDLTRMVADVLCEQDWHDLVCDEAQILKSSGSGRSQAMWQLREKAEVAAALTGTPIDRSVDDLASIYAWARGDADLWRGQRLTKRFDMTDSGARTEFRRTLGPAVYRRDRSEIADELPRIATEVVLLDPSPAEKRLANAARSELKAIYDDLVAKLEAAEELAPDDDRYAEAKAQLQTARGAALGGITLARMAASDPAAVAASDSPGALLLRSKNLVAPAVRKPGTKRTQIVELVTDLVGRGEAVLIFTDFSTVANNLAGDFAARGVTVGTVIGSQTAKVRDRNIAGFQNGDIDVLVLTSAGKEGLNLQRASTLIHYELPWLPSTIVQRNARANRIGATNETLQILIPLMAGTIEERVASVVVPRAVIASAALDEGRVDPRQTELGVALTGLVDAVNDAEVSKRDMDLMSVARSVLG